MATDTAQRERAIRLAEKLIAITPESEVGLRRRSMQIRDRLRTPMQAVLAKVPGETVTEKAKKLGVTRQAFYAWLKGEYRPNKQQSKRLASLTGYSVEEIRGRSTIS